MRTEGKSELKRRKRTKTRVLKLLLILTVAVITLAFLSAPAFVSSATFRETVNSNLEIPDPKGRKIEIAQINSAVNLRPPGEQTNFNVSMAVVEENKQSKIQAGGRVQPEASKTGWSLKGTTGDFIVEVNDFDLGSLGSILALAGVEVEAKGVVSANIRSEVKDGQLDNLTGTIKGEDLDITGPQLKGDRLQTGSLDVNVEMNRDGKKMNIGKLRIKSDWAELNADGVVPAKVPGSLADLLEDDSNYSFKGSFNCDLAAVLSQMPQTLGLKEGTKVTSGKLTGNVETFTKAGKAKIGGQANLAGLAGMVDGKEIALSEPIRANLDITADNNEMNFDNLSLSAAFAKINASGNAEQIKYDGQIGLAQLQSELGQFINIGPYQIAGAFSSKGQISIGKSKIAAVGSSALENLRLSSAEGVTASEPMAEIAFAFNIDWENNILTLDSVEANAGLGNISTKGAVLPMNKNAAKPIELTVFANTIDLQKLRPFAVLFASLPQDTQLSGIAESRLSVSAKENIYQIVTDATSIKNLKLVAPDEKPFEQEDVSLILNAEINPEQKAINVKTLKLESPQVKIEKGESK
ncbi:MAG: hypothetical protein AMJ75_08665 [Phycisphaerae bacterium SM1_79]|nr:MAG: hypothetical protein AMJ75_08665 [Phycisphaerae bacterium SM1_79]